MTLAKNLLHSEVADAQLLEDAVRAAGYEDITVGVIPGISERQLSVTAISPFSTQWRRSPRLEYLNPLRFRSDAAALAFRMGMSVALKGNEWHVGVAQGDALAAVLEPFDGPHPSDASEKAYCRAIVNCLALHGSKID